jgi:uncharacterized protein (TIGR01777 family)
MATIVLAGGSGFLGRKLQARLERDGHQVLVLTRHPKPGIATDVQWQPNGSRGTWADRLDGSEAVINLAGENLGAKRWTKERKQVLRESRLVATRTLVDAVKKSQTPPRVFVNASAIGYYGPRKDERITERTAPGHDALAQLCVAWEREAAQMANDPRTRLAIIRTGLPLSPDGGVLRELLLPFKLGFGATLSSGRQFMSWVHIDDWIELVVWLIATADAHGPFNVTAPTPVTNREFTKTLARVLHRPALFRAPGNLLKLVIGEYAELAITGQRVLPAHAERMGFQFRFRELEPALRDLLEKRTGHRDTETQRQTS